MLWSARNMVECVIWCGERSTRSAAAHRWPVGLSEDRHSVCRLGSASTYLSWEPIQILSLWLLEDRAIFESDDRERRGNAVLPGSEKSLRKLWEHNNKVCTIRNTEKSKCYVRPNYNFRMPDSEHFFHGASSGSYGSGPWTGGSSSVSLQTFWLCNYPVIKNQHTCKRKRDRDRIGNGMYSVGGNTKEYKAGKKHTHTHNTRSAAVQL